MSQFATVEDAKYYAYVHARPDGRIFYVGKGCKKRAHTFPQARRNKHHGRICAKYGVANIQVGLMYCTTEAIAYELEVGLIKCLTRMGVELTNQVAGGRGGVAPTAEVRAVHSVNTKRMMQHPILSAKVKAAQRASMTPEECARHSERAKKLWQDPEYRARAVAARLGNSYNKGYKCTPEQIQNRQRAARISNMKRNYGDQWREEYIRRYSEHKEDV